MGIVHTVSTGEWHNFSPLENSQISLNSFHFFFLINRFIRQQLRCCQVFGWIPTFKTKELKHILPRSEHFMLVVTFQVRGEGLFWILFLPSVLHLSLI